MLCQGTSISRFCTSSFLPSVQHAVPMMTYRRAKVEGINDVISAKLKVGEKYSSNSKALKKKKNFNKFDDYDMLTSGFSKGKYGVWSLDEIKPESPWVPLEDPSVSNKDTKESFAQEGEDEQSRYTLRNSNNHRVHSWNMCKNELYSVIDNVDGKVQDQYTGKWYDLSRGRSPLSVEHIVPRCVVKKYSSIVQDLHNLIPVESGLNSRRSSLPFGEGNCSGGEKSCVINERMILRDEIKGFIARSVIYVFVMYEKELKERNRNMLNINAVGNIEMLVEWCLKYYPTDYEITRNNRIEESQGNRNPFIDDTSLCKLALTIKGF